MRFAQALRRASAWRITAAGAVGLLAFAMRIPPAAAQDVEGFYKGRTIDLVVGYPPGGSNDIYARAIANRIGAHMPGHPSVIVRNMPGAGSFLAANHLATTAPRDGTTLGIVSPTVALDEKLGSAGVRFKTSDFAWIGRVNSLVNVIFMWERAGVQSIEAAQERPATLAGTGAGSAVSVYPTVLNNVVGTKFKLVMGYRGSNEAMLAVERGEAEGHCTGWDTLQTTHPDWLAGGQAKVIVQFALHRHPDLPQVPTAVELARTPEEKQVLSAVMNATEVGTSFFTTPGVPRERVEALRAAFDATMGDPAFLADLKTLRVGISPMKGADVQELIASVGQLSPKLTDQLKVAYGNAAAN
jgi:tripartite-type tricarboxylate transporter receptor subunit TctC